MKWRPTIRGRGKARPKSALAEELLRERLDAKENSFVTRRLAQLTKENVAKPRPPNVVLSACDAGYIKGQLAAGASQSWLAMKFGVSGVTVLNIGRGKKWADVPTPELELEGPPKGTHVKKWLAENGRSI